MADGDKPRMADARVVTLDPSRHHALPVPASARRLLAVPDLHGLAPGMIRANTFAIGSPPPRHWHVQHLIPGDSATLFTGDGGGGKSIVSLQLAAATVTGKRWLDREVRHGSAIYLTTEDSAEEVWRRLVDLTVLMDFSLEELGDLIIWSLTSTDAPDPLLAAPSVRDGGAALIGTPTLEMLAETIRRMRPKLVVVDTLADTFGGDENNRAQARQFIGMLRRLAQAANAAVLIVAHPSRAGLQDSSGYSGSTAWSNSVRSRIYLEKPKPNDGEPVDSDVRILSHLKSNYSEKQDAVRLRRRLGGYDVDGSSPTLSPAAVDALFLDLLAQFTEQGRKVSDGKGPNWAPTKFAQHPRASGVNSAAFARAMERLLDRKAIAVEPAERGTRKLVIPCP